MAPVNTPRLSAAFQNAKQDFLSSLKDPSLFDSVTKITSIHDVYAFTTQLQHDQSKRRGLRNLRKIAPYLDRLKQYAGVIEVFVQAKPEILAFIWGPIKLLLQMSDNLTQSFDAVVEAMAVIGNKLPLFEAYTLLFKESDRVADVLVLFYKDILDFYEIALNFFSAKRWVFVFDSVWPRHKAKINVVVSSIERHCLLMTEEVSLEHISEAHRARIEDMDRWQRNFEFQERQNFINIETCISPKLYDDELDRLQRKICDRTGRWLEREQALKEWFDSSDASTRIVWLQGIPGAGKTHISSIIVDKLKGLSKTTLFVFLSYKQGDISTVSIVHSLIFQLIGAEDLDETLKQDLRAKLFNTFQSSQRSLKSNTRFARETLTDLLKCVGPTYIIIDGLDEIPKSESMLETLNELLEMLKVSTETRLLISSRAQDEIATVLKKVMPKVVRVDDKNRGCIQAYVSITSEKWLGQSGFDEEARLEIKSLLAPLAAKAKGMFLYARVVMDNIQMCHTADLVQNELRVLPESLEEAYARVLQRLNDLQPSLRAMSRRALGWIGCSQVPIKIQELSFALSFDPGREGELPRSESLLNIVRLCGPIVETLDDSVYFVHFTVQEYLFDKQDDTFIRTLEANLEIARTCLRYLSFNIFEVDLEPDIIKQNILSGSYRLHWFAATQWIGSIQRCARLLCNRTPPESLIHALDHFVYECENGNYEATVELVSQQNDEFHMFRENKPDIHRLLHQELQFRRMDVGDWMLEDDEEDSWTNLDPFVLSYASLRIYQQFESLLCPGENHMASCNCPKLKRLYGKRLFRCKYAICQSQQIAFETRSNRDAHCRSHDRAYKCPHSSCDFSSLGFLSRSQLNKHMDNCHPHAVAKPIHLIQNPDEDEIVPLLSDMIAMGMTAEVSTLCPRFKTLDKSLRKRLLQEAAFSGSLQMFQCLLDTWNWKDYLLLICANESIKGEHTEVLQWIAPRIPNIKLSHTYFTDMATFMRLGANTESAEVFEIWKKHAASYKLRTSPFIVEETVFQNVKDPVKQERLAGVLSEQASLGQLTTYHLSRALKSVASTTCSVSITKVLLDKGADVDFRSKNWKGNETIKTPLISAAAKRTKEAAEMMRLLLLAGADPNASFQRNKDSEPKTAATELGAQGISKWLGLTWDELVEWAAEQRSNDLQGKVVSRLPS